MPTSISDATQLDDIAAVLAALPTADDTARADARARQDTLTKPPGALGQLEDVAVWLAGWQGTPRPRVENALMLVFAGNHGVTAQGVSPFPAAVTAQMVANFAAGGAAINQLCKWAGAALDVVPLELDRPTADFTEGPAMGADETLAAMQAGAAAIRPGADLLALGEMGIGNTTVASALACALFGGPATDWVGPGTGSDAGGIARKAEVVARATARHAGLTPLAILAALGGREQAAIAGAVLEARLRGIPVVLDGFICTAAAAPLAAAQPDALDHCIVGHMSAEPGHARLLTALGKTGLVDLGLRLGEGSGAALALGLVQAALACHNGMATFAEAGVADG
ncbi:MAG: nicotinate-nucleotide--dimethylbenzimidazole phosphoribosyltransferase [Pseudomonadota bacterium]